MDNSFRRAVATDTKRSSGGRGSRRAFYESYRFPKDTSASVVFRKGQFEDPEDPGKAVPYYKYAKHIRKVQPPGAKMRIYDCVCAKGLDKYSQAPCFGCDQAKSGDKSISDAIFTAALQIVHLALYHRHPIFDENGNVRVRSDTNEPIMVDDECAFPNCNFCRVLSGQQPVLQPGQSFPNYPPNSILTFYGRRRFIEAGKRPLSAFLGWDKLIGERCGTCKAKVRPVALTCANCGQIHCDLNQQPQFIPELDKVTAQQYGCGGCGQQVYLNTQVVCDACASAGRQMQTFGLFDVVVSGARVGEGTNTTLQFGGSMTFEEFEQQIPAQYLQGKALRQIIEELSEPYNFAELLAPATPDVQMKLLGYDAGPQQPRQMAMGFYGATQSASAQPAQPFGPYPQQGAAPVQHQQGGFPQPGPAPFLPGAKPNFGK
jgi:hypothetical protein